MSMFVVMHTPVVVEHCSWCPGFLLAKVKNSAINASHRESKAFKQCTHDRRSGGPIEATALVSPQAGLSLTKRTVAMDAGLRFYAVDMRCELIAHTTS
jgi:hypothetical protein